MYNYRECREWHSNGTHQIRTARKVSIGNGYLEDGFNSVPRHVFIRDRHLIN